MSGRDQFGHENADGRAGWPFSQGHQAQHGHRADSPLDNEVHRQRSIRPTGLEQAAVERQEHEHRRRHENGSDADTAALTQQDRDLVPAGDDEDGPRQDRHRTVPVQPTRPVTDLVGRSPVFPQRHPPHHGHDHGRSGQGENQKQTGQLNEHSVRVHREEAGHGHGHNDIGPIGNDTRRRQRSRLQEPGPERFGSRRLLRIEHELAAQRRRPGTRGQRDCRRNPLDQHLGHRRRDALVRRQSRPPVRSAVFGRHDRAMRAGARHWFHHIVIGPRPPQCELLTRRPWVGCLCPRRARRRARRRASPADDESPPRPREQLGSLVSAPAAGGRHVPSLRRRTTTPTRAPTPNPTRDIPPRH